MGNAYDGDTLVRCRNTVPCIARLITGTLCVCMYVCKEGAISKKTVARKQSHRSRFFFTEHSLRYTICLILAGAMGEIL